MINLNPFVVSVELLSAVDRANLLGQKLLMVISEEKTD